MIHKKQFGELILAPFQQSLCAEEVDDVYCETQKTVIASGIISDVKAGETVCIGVPSRGISSMKEVLRGVVDVLVGIAAEPFIVPAMGSHGGGTAEGQREVLAGYGISEEMLSVPVKSDIKADQVGNIGFNGKSLAIFWDRYAAKADRVLVINRIKEHTAFTGSVESGLMKILSVGLGKPDGAKIMHQAGLKEAIPVVSHWLMNHFPVLGGIAIIENGLHAPMAIEAIPADQIPEREPQLLENARKVLPRIPFNDLDVLIIGQMGKDISGTGMDTNVIGKYRRNWGEPSPNYQRIIVIDLTEASHGNATGVGFADVITKKLFDKIDLPATQLNCLTAGNFNGAKIPIVAKDTAEAVEWAMQGMDSEAARIAYVESTLALETIWVSEVLVEECKRIGMKEIVA
jgi:hypothetical protein